ncbi:DUF5908 family protein [Niveispirillum sp. KHB5.9]|uniref:DUF5908 family protein n=1 Tax=Niveispirillum sp. KHB5.9 TaxID=3400269 RepID=UPI003A86E828
MPLVINEIAIRMAVGEATPAAAGPAAGDGPGRAGTDQAAMDEIVERCVARVLAALRTERER